MTEYDIVKAFKRIEYELQESMMRNFNRHKAQELKEGFEWEQWQSLQLRELARYRHDNRNTYWPQFAKLNDSTAELFDQTAQKSEAKQANQLNKLGYQPVNDDNFFKFNDNKLRALQETTKADFNRAEYSVLRKAEDQYRRIIFDAQVYASTGATYEKAVDMAAKDFLKAGINSIQYKNGSRHTIKDYARMAIRTGNKRAYLMGEGNARDSYGIHTVRVNSRVDACPVCAEWLNRVLVDDVYSGGTYEEAMEYGVPTLSDAIADGFLHPNCKDVYSLYIPGVSRKAKDWTPKELENLTKTYNTEQQLQRATDMFETYDRMANLCLDAEDKETYRARAEMWQDRISALEGNE